MLSLLETQNGRRRNAAVKGPEGGIQLRNALGRHSPGEQESGLLVTTPNTVMYPRKDCLNRKRNGPVLGQGPQINILLHHQYCKLTQNTTSFTFNTQFKNSFHDTGVFHRKDFLIFY